MSIFKKKIIKTKDGLQDFIDLLIAAKSQQLKVKAHAIEHAIDLISKTISKSEIMVYRQDVDNKIKPLKNDEYYVLNIQPNDNEQGTSFFYNVLNKYLHDEEALIINFNSKLYLADNFNISHDLLMPKTYSNVQISDSHGNTMIFKKVFSANEVIHLDLKNSNIQETLNDYYSELGKLIGVASTHYKLTNSHKFRLKKSGGQPKLMDPETNKQLDYTEYKKRLTKGLFDEEDSVILLSEVFGLEKISFGDVAKSDEWDKLEKKWSDKVATAFNIPLDIFNGNKTDKSTSTNDFITFGVLPHLQILEDGLNAKIIGKTDYLKGECIKINRLNMKHFDILESANSMDKLFADGFSHNEILSVLGMEPLDEEWASKHFITKNYQNADLAMKGGDEIEE